MPIRRRVLIVLDSACMPGNDEDDEGRDDAEQLDETVEEEVAVEAAGVKAGNEKNADQSNKAPVREWIIVNVPVHRRLSSSCSVLFRVCS